MTRRKMETQLERSKECWKCENLISDAKGTNDAKVTLQNLRLDNGI